MSGISNQSVLVELNISVWTGRKRDKLASDEVVSSNHAQSKQAARVIKSLFADEPKLTAIVSLSQVIRNWHYSNTLPWSDTGTRLLPMKNFLIYKRELTDWEQKYTAAVDEFITNYPTLVSAAAFQLGNLFSRAEYPAPADIRQKFALNCLFTPVPDSGDFRIDADDEELEELKKQYETHFDKRMEDAMTDTWRRLYECLSRMSTQLGFDQGRKKRIHTSMFDSAKALTGLLSGLNVTNDPALEDARKDLEAALATMNAEDIRKHEGARDMAKRSVDKILDGYGTMFNEFQESENANAEGAAGLEAVAGDADVVCETVAPEPAGAVEAESPVRGAGGGAQREEGAAGGESGPDVGRREPAKPDFSFLDF